MFTFYSMKAFKNLFMQKEAKCRNSKKSKLYYPTPLSYNFNQENVKHFLENSAPDVRNILEKLLKNTLHISYNEFVSLLEINMHYFLKTHKMNTNKPLHVFLFNTPESNTIYRYKSNMWVMNHLISSFPKIQFNVINDINDECIQDGDTILILDDCIYSGQQIGGEVIYKNMLKNTKNNLQICVFAPFMSNEGMKTIDYYYKRNEQLRNKNCKIHIFAQVIIKPIKELLDVNEFKKIFKYYNQQDIGQEEKYAIYFDHKLADYKSTFPYIYSGVVPNQYNMQLLKKIDESKHVLQQKYIQKLEIYPLFQNCENQRLPDIWNTTCPYPPYKIGYDNFVKNINHKAIPLHVDKDTSIESIILSPNEQKQQTIEELKETIKISKDNVNKFNENILRMEQDGAYKTMEFIYNKYKEGRDINLEKIKTTQEKLKALQSGGKKNLVK